MWLQFLLENFHFAVSLLTALVFFAVAWLYFDAWLGHKKLREGLRVSGFILLSLAFIFQAVTVESSVFSLPFLGADILLLCMTIAKITGYLLVNASLLLDPLQPKPKYAALSAITAVKSSPGSWIFLIFLTPILAGLTGLLFLRRGTLGLEKHLRPIAISFYLYSLYEVLALRVLFGQSDNVQIYNLTAPFHLLWIAEYSVLFLATLLLGKWVFGYLLKRLQTQMFMIFNLTVLGIFLITTVTFTALILRNLQQETLSQLSTDVKVLAYAIESKKSETLSDAEVIAQNPAVLQDIKSKERKNLTDLAMQFLLTKKQTSVVITDKDGKVLARGEDANRAGDMVGDDPVFKQAMTTGKDMVSLIAKDGAMAGIVDVRSAARVMDGQSLAGMVLIETSISNTFLDGIKQNTGLDCVVYAGNQVSAGTLMMADNKSRITGIKEEDPRINTTVLQNGEDYAGDVTILNEGYYGAFEALKDLNGMPIGMLFAGKPQYSILQTAGASLQLTFLVSGLLLLLAILPSYLISRYLTYQIE